MGVEGRLLHLRSMSVVEVRRVLVLGIVEGERDDVCRVRVRVRVMYVMYVILCR